MTVIFFFFFVLVLVFYPFVGRLRLLVSFSCFRLHSFPYPFHHVFLVFPVPRFASRAHRTIVLHRTSILRLLLPLLLVDLLHMFTICYFHSKRIRPALILAHDVARNLELIRLRLRPCQIGFSGPHFHGRKRA